MKKNLITLILAATIISCTPEKQSNCDIRLNEYQFKVDSLSNELNTALMQVDAAMNEGEKQLELYLELKNNCK